MFLESWRLSSSRRTEAACEGPKTTTSHPKMISKCLQGSAGGDADVSWGCPSAAPLPCDGCVGSACIPQDQGAAPITLSLTLPKPGSTAPKTSCFHPNQATFPPVVISIRTAHEGAAKGHLPLYTTACADGTDGNDPVKFMIYIPLLAARRAGICWGLPHLG